MRTRRTLMNDDPWKGLSEGNMRRVDAHGKHDFFWATIENKGHCLGQNQQDADLVTNERSDRSGHSRQI